MKLSVVIPAQNEENSVAETVNAIAARLAREEIDHEVIVVDDSSTDATAAVVESISADNPRVRCLPSPYRNGFGLAVRAGLEAVDGDAVAIVMADGSDWKAPVSRSTLSESHGFVFASTVAPWADASGGEPGGRAS